MLDKFTAILDYLLDKVPEFLASEPIVYFVGILICCFVLQIFKGLMNISRR